MATLNINGKEYDLDTLSETARGQAQSISFVDEELKRLQSQIAVCNTARNAYLRVLIQELEAHDASTANKQ